MYCRVELEILQRDAAPSDREEVEVASFGIPKQVLCIHGRIERVNESLCSHGKFLGAFKPGNRSRHVKGLYLSGGAAHPGPGMPMVMMSGWIAADSFDQDVKQQAAA